MINTKAFKTKSEILEKKLPRINGNNQYQGKTIIAIDGGYSSVKGASPNKVFLFPSYAKKADEDVEIVAKVSSTDIQFRDNNTGEIWFVGEAAEKLMVQSDIDSTTDASLFTRYRYDSDIFHVIMATGIAIGLWGTGSGNEIFLQTGLPSTYKTRDEAKLIKALKGDYDISIKLGSGEWTNFKFTLDEEHIDVIEQPQGTLCATAYENGEVSPLGKQVLRSNSIILDIGFGTEDIFSVRSGYRNSHQTYSDTGMRAVFEEVIKEITKKHPDAELKIFAFQNFLESGKASYFNVEELKMYEVDFSEILERKNRELCDKSIRRLLQDYDNLLDYDNLIVTGGTGESRFEQIQQMLSGLPNLRILPGNMNTPDLSFSYSNVIGYYMLRHAKLMAKLKTIS